MFKRIASLLLISFVASCGGGGGDAGKSIFGDGTTSANTADVILTLSSATLPSTGSATVNVTATAVDSSRNTLASVPVTLSVDGGAVLGTVSGASTGSDGTVTALLSTGSSRANRVVTVTASSGSISKTATVSITGTTISATLVPVVIPSQVSQIQYSVRDQSSNPVANQPVQIEAPGLNPPEITDGVTDANGSYTYAYTASATSGTYTVTTVIAGVTNIQMITVQPTGTVAPVTVAVQAASVSSNPSVVSTSTQTGSTIRALFVGANNLPIANVRARFDLNGDPNSIGGTFTTGAATLYSDANGVVTTTYLPGTRSSPTNGVQIRVCYGVTDTDPLLLNCANSKVTLLTVTSEPLGVSIGTNGQIIVNELTYVKKFVISVVDAAGVAMPDVNLTASIDLPIYRKGAYNLPAVTGSGTTSQWGQVVTAICLNEDTNRNGVIDTFPIPEDINGDGQLWPRKPDVIVSLDSPKTGADGTAVLRITYAQDHASWVDALITVSASGVSGSEGRATYSVAPVPVDAAAILNTSATPAFVRSPYGVAGSCTNPN